MGVARLADALRRLDALLVAICDAEEARAQRMYAGDKGWESLRRSLSPTAAELAYDPSVPEIPLAAPGEVPALTALADRAHLSALEVDVLVVLLAPHVEPRYGKLYAVLQDEPAAIGVTERLLFTVLGRGPARAAELARSLTVDGTLVGAGLVRCAPGVFAARLRTLDLAPGVRDALLGLPLPGVVAGLELTWRQGADALDPPPLQVVWGGGERDDVAAAIAGPLLAIAHPRTPPDRDAIEALWQSATLHGAALVLDVAALGADEGLRAAEHLRELVRRHGGHVVIESDGPLALAAPHHAAPTPGYAARRVAWAEAAAAHGVALADRELDRLAGNHPVTRAQLDAIFGASAGARVDAAELGRIAHRLRRLEIRHAQLLPGDRTFDDLVLRPSTREALERLVYYVEARDRVAEERGLEHRFRMQRGPVVLFAGRSGTGKTLAAEVVAGAVGRPLAVVDLSRLVSKYIGETEKHIDEILRAGERSGAVLFFDEADALFSARTDVASSNDRYANLEVGYLLQRIEQHDGLVILATNLQQSIDEAFLRRFHARIEFPFPDAGERRAIWPLMLGASAADLDLDRLARHRLAGGDIRNAALKAVFLAERDGAAVTQAHAERAVALELYELGRLSRFDAETTDSGRRLRELIEVLEAELEASLRGRFLKEIHFVHGAPTKEAMAGKRPAVSLALYRMASSDGSSLRLGLIVSAWSSRPEEEAELLGVLLELLARRGSVEVGGKRASLRMQASFDFDLIHRFWSSHGHPIRPSLVLDVEVA